MRIECKGEGVQVRGNVAGAARIRVVAPCPPDICRPLDHHKIVVAPLLQSNRHSHPGESRPHDSHTNMTDMRFAVRRLAWKGRGLAFVRKCLAVAACKNPEHMCFLLEW